MNRIAFSIALLAIVTLASAQDGFTTTPKDAKSVKMLPKHVAAADGELSLYADYGAAKDGKVPVYLVNRTKDRVVVPAQDGDIYLKIQAGDDKGKWHRAQTHRFSWCGNSYVALLLDAGKYLKVNGHFPEKGEPSLVRYKLFGSLKLVSNTGMGRVDPKSIVEASFDEMAIRTADVEKCAKVLFDEKLKTEKTLQHQFRQSAIYRLSNLPEKAAGDLLLRVMNDDDFENFYNQAYSALVRGHSELFEEYLLAAIRDTDAEHRKKVLRYGRGVAPIQNKELRSLVLRLAADRNDPQLPNLIAIVGFGLGTQKDEDARKLLASIQNDEKYRADIRELAAYQLAHHYGDQLLHITVQLEGNYSEGYRRPIPMIITVKNQSDKKIEFDYKDPSEFIRMHVGIRTMDKYPLELYHSPKANVCWFEKSKADKKTKTLSLGPGQSTTIQMNILDYFDLPKKEEPTSYMLVWTSYKMPGYHKLPQICHSAPSIPLATVK